MFTPSLQPAAKQICGTNHGTPPLAYTANKHTAQNPTHSTQHSLFFKADKKNHFGAIVTAPSFDAELHIETTTIMFADVVESVRLIEQNETANVIRIRSLLKSLATTVIPAHQGTVIERRGDGLLVKFSDARASAACALVLHREAELINIDIATDDVIALRVGIHSAEVMADGDAIYGQGINLAARIASIAGPGETVISSSLRDQLTHRVDGELRDLGECFLKNVSEAVRAYQLCPLAVIPATEKIAPLPIEDLSKHCTILAVLPLVATRNSSRALGSADVFVDQVLSVLSQCPVLRVISRLSTNAYRGRDIRSVAAGASVSAHYVVGGSYDDDGASLTMRLELVHCGSGEVIWEHAMRATHAEVLNSDSDIVCGVASRVLDALTRTELTIAHGRPLPNLAAHTLYLSAVTFLHRFSRTDFDRARQMLDALRERAPRNAAPAAWLARWHVFRIVQGWSTDVRRDGSQAGDYAKRALDHDPKSSLALVMAGSVEAGVNRDMNTARDYYDKALICNPNEPLAWLLKSVAHGFMGEAREALTSSETSLQLSPLDPLRFYYDSLSSAAAMGAQEYSRAIALAQRAIRSNCMHGSAYRTLAIAQVMMGDSDSARDTVRRLLAVEPSSTVAQFRARSAVQSDQNAKFATALASAGLPESLGATA